MSSIQLSNIHLTYQHQKLFQGLNLSFQQQKWTSLLGPSGVGKTSLLRMMANLLKDNTARASMNIEPNSIAYLSQDDCLLPWLSALDNTLIGYRLRGDLSIAIRTEAIHLMEKVGLQRALYQKPDSLSGGMRQRTALVRVLMEKKPVVLLDEPFSSLDTITRLKLQELAFELLQEKTIILVTHDPLEALRLSHEIIILGGQPVKIIKTITPESAPLRNIQDEALLKLQGELLMSLEKACEY